MTWAAPPPGFPLAGLIIGSLLWLADQALTVIFPRHLTDALLVALLALLTGALHLDGLADVCDGLAARGDKQHFLAVMKDSRVGAVGVVGVVVGLLLKYAALLAVPIYLKGPALLLFPALARFGQVTLLTGSRSARSDGLGTLCFEWHAAAANFSWPPPATFPHGLGSDCGSPDWWRYRRYSAGHCWCAAGLPDA